jgi:hypothetical protein
MKQQKTKPKRYIAIVKIGNNPNGTARCLKYHFDDLLKFTNFLDTKWKEWKWFNLFANRGENKGIQLGNFTKNKRPKKRQI